MRLKQLRPIPGRPLSYLLAVSLLRALCRLLYRILTTSPFLSPELGARPHYQQPIHFNERKEIAQLDHSLFSTSSISRAIRFIFRAKKYISHNDKGYYNGSHQSKVLGKLSSEMGPDNGQAVA
ncbi:hypothetical protein EDD21DRAFT_3810 [Dissophora ornata]|nr:hypothetical protein EDD21DRAFT_3810 [Dissophora ornata]